MFLQIVSVFFLKHIPYLMKSTTRFCRTSSDERKQDTKQIDSKQMLHPHNLRCKIGKEQKVKNDKNSLCSTQGKIKNLAC